MGESKKKIIPKGVSFIRKYFIALFSIGIILLVLSLFLYFKTFNGNLSENSNNWSNFGSYVGGIVGCILSGLNLLILIILTFQTKEQQNHEWITSIRIKKYHELIDALKSNANPQQYFIEKNLDDDFFLFDDNYATLMEMQKLLRENYLTQTKDDLLKFLKSIIKSDKSILKEFVLKYKMPS